MNAFLRQFRVRGEGARRGGFVEGLLSWPSRTSERWAGSVSAFTGLALLVPLSLCVGCKIPTGTIVSSTQSFIGIRVGQNQQTGSPQLDIGFVRTTLQFVPTSTNQIYAPSVNSSLSLDQRAFSTSIDEMFLTGDAKHVPDSPAAIGSQMRGKMPMKGATGNGYRRGASASPTVCVTNSPTTCVTNSLARVLYPGLLVTFINAPSAEAVSLMEAAGAKRSGTNEFVIEVYSRHDERQGAAIGKALREHAVLAGWRATP